MTPPQTGPIPAAQYTELLIPGPAEALAGLLDIEMPLATGDPLPPLWHWVYLLARPRQNELGPDGHPMRGIPEPPGPDRQRMFAGGRVTTYTSLRLGEPATRTTRVLRSVEKNGRSGHITFATIRTEITQADNLAIVEEQDIVYRHTGTRPPAPPQALKPNQDRTARSQYSVNIEIDEAALFRFSALTYNAHRIHYDRDYAASEGYPDLVIHGPLQALLMSEAIRRFHVPILGREFSYRLVSPTFGSQRLTANLWNSDHRTETQVNDQAEKCTATGRLAH